LDGWKESAPGLVGAAMSLPYFEAPSLDARVPIHAFGVIAAVGITVGAWVLRRYARRVGETEAEARRVTGWVAITGILGAHVLDVLFYRPGEALHHPVVLLELWTSISSYGGFVGGALGFAFITWRRRLHRARWADITVVGLLVAFSIGRAGCTVVNDHIGAETTSPIGVDYPREVLAEHGVLAEMTSSGSPHSSAPDGSGETTIRAHNLGLEELLYLMPVNALVLWLAFRRKRLPAGALVVITAGLYAPVRFGLEHWRLASSDPPYAGLTFAQWCSIAVFVAAVAWGARLFRARASAH
jgi:phosphatidylglycerol:prolipoprotein diacylglycerol transferase